MEAIERTLPTEPAEAHSSEKHHKANGYQRSASPTVSPSEGMVRRNQRGRRENDETSSEIYEISHSGSYGTAGAPEIDNEHTSRISFGFS